jgi:WD domain, G-beta repeat
MEQFRSWSRIGHLSNWQSRVFTCLEGNPQDTKLLRQFEMVFLDKLRRLGFHTLEIFGLLMNMVQHPSHPRLMTDLLIRIRKWLSHAYSVEQKHLLGFDDSKRQFQDLHLAASLNDANAAYIFLHAGFNEDIRVQAKEFDGGDLFTPLGVFILYSHSSGENEYAHVILESSRNFADENLFVREVPTVPLFQLAARRGRTSVLQLFEKEKPSLFQEVWPGLVRLAMAGDHTETASWIFDKATEPTPELQHFGTVRDPLNGSVYQILDIIVPLFAYAKQQRVLVQGSIQRSETTNMDNRSTLALRPKDGKAAHQRVEAFDPLDSNAHTIQEPSDTLDPVAGPMIQRSWRISTSHRSPAPAKHQEIVNRIPFIPNGSSSCPLFLDDGRVFWWDPLNGSQQKSFDSAYRLVWDSGNTSDARKVAYLSQDSSENIVRVHDLDTGARRSITCIHGAKKISVVALSPDSQMLATGFFIDNNVKLWDLRRGAETVTLSKTNHCVGSLLTFSPTSRLLACSYHVGASTEEGECQIMVLWDLQTQSERLVLQHPAKYPNLVFSPVTDVLGYVHEDRTVVVWDLAAGSEVFRLVGHTADILGISFSEEATYIATCSKDKTVRVWGGDTGDLKWQFEGHKDWVLDVVFCPEENYVVSNSRDGTIKVWDLI